MISDLVKCSQIGDREAWNQLYNATCRDAYFVALKTCGKEQDAMDLVHDAFLTAYTHLAQLQQPEKFQAWLNMIVANKCRDYLKKKRPMLFSEMGNEEDSIMEWEDDRECNLPERQLDRAETSRIVAELIESLPDEQRLCVLLYYKEEMGISEIAQALQISDGTVKSRLNYARKKVADKVRELEKKGTKLYGLSPIPFLIWLLRAEAESTMVPAVITSGTTAAAIVSGTTATAAKATATAGIKGLLSGLGAKIAAGAAAAAVLIGGGIGIYNVVVEKEETFDLNKYLVVEGFDGLNGQGEVVCYLDKETLVYDIQLAYGLDEKMKENADDALLEGLRVLEEIGNILDCITVAATPDKELSNGDVVTVTARFENTSGHEIHFSFKNAEKRVTAEGLVEGKTFDPFSEDNLVITQTGFSGVGELTFDVRPSDQLPQELCQHLQYSLSQYRELSNGDVVTVTVAANKLSVEALGYSMPEQMKKEITVSGLPELVDTTYHFADAVLQPLKEDALKFSQADEQEHLNDYTISTPSNICEVFFINSINRNYPYSSLMDGIVVQNAVVVATNYVMDYKFYDATVSRSYVSIYPNWAINADGELTYESDHVIRKFAAFVEPGKFMEWMEMEFNFGSDQVEIVSLSA